MLLLMKYVLLKLLAVGQFGWFGIPKFAKTFQKVRRKTSWRYIPSRCCPCSSCRCWRGSRRWGGSRRRARSPGSRCTCSCSRCWSWSSHPWRGGAAAAAATGSPPRTVPLPHARSPDADWARASRHRRNVFLLLVRYPRRRPCNPTQNTRV